MKKNDKTLLMVIKEDLSQWRELEGWVVGRIPVHSSVIIQSSLATPKPRLPTGRGEID